MRSLTQSCAPCSQRLSNKLQIQMIPPKAISKLKGTIHLEWIKGWLNEKCLGTRVMKISVSGFQKLWLSMVNFRNHWAYDKTPFASKRVKKYPGSCAKHTETRTEWHEILNRVYFVHYQKQFSDSSKLGWAPPLSKSNESHSGFPWVHSYNSN